MASSPISTPRLTLETINFFVAEDSPHKLADITDSLDHAGLLTGNNLTVATTLYEAEEVIISEVPGHLTHNVYLLDGNLDSKTRAMHHGRALLGRLIAKYNAPIHNVVLEADKTLKALGLSARERETIIRTDGTYEVASERLTLDALFVGISRFREGELDYPAQIPWTSYDEVGDVVAAAVLSKKERTYAQSHRKREQQQAQADAIREARTAKRAASLLE